MTNKIILISLIILVFTNCFSRKWETQKVNDSRCISECILNTLDKVDFDDISNINLDLLYNNICKTCKDLYLENCYAEVVIESSHPDGDYYEYRLGFYRLLIEK
jgi:hypothetical protein